MATDPFLKKFGAIMGIAGGFLLGTAHLFHLLEWVNIDETIIKSLIFFSHLVLIFTFIAFYDMQGQHNGWISKFGLLLSILGTGFVIAVVFIEMMESDGANSSLIPISGITANLATIGPLFFVVGMLFVGGAIIKANVLPSISGYCLMIGTLTFATASLIPERSDLLSFLGGAITGIGFITGSSFILIKTRNLVGIDRLKQIFPEK